jgi:hypothetical protein
MQVFEYLGQYGSAVVHPSDSTNSNSKNQIAHTSSLPLPTEKQAIAASQNLLREVIKIEKLHRGHRGGTEFREAQTTLNIHASYS